jgi:hypothetical protein
MTVTEKTWNIRMNNELTGMWKEAIIVSLKVTQHLFGETVEKFKI